MDNMQMLVDELHARGRHRVVQHPGQMSPAEPLQKYSDADKQLIGQAAALLIADATHPDVLMMLSEIGPWAEAQWIPALLNRLEQGPPITEEPCYATGPVVEHLTSTLARPHLAEEMKVRIRQVLAQHEAKGGLVQFLIVHGDKDGLQAAIAAYEMSDKASQSLVQYAKSRLARMG